MARTDQKLAWAEIDPETLDTQSRRLYEKLREARKAAAEAKEAFEESVRDRADVPKGKRLVFAYNFGKLSAALSDDDAKPKAAAKAQGSLADFLRQAQASGRRA